MTPTEKERLVNRIIAGCFKCEIEDELGKSTILLLKYPNRLQRYLAEEIYLEALRKAELDGSYNETDYMALLHGKGIWSKEQQLSLDGLAKDIEELKIGLFKSTFKSQQRATIRKALEKAKEAQLKLHTILHEHDYLSAKGVAYMTKARYIIAASLCKLDGSRLFNEYELLLVSDYIVESVASIVSNQKLNEGQIRELARSEPWRSIWISKKAENNLFGISAVDLNDEQRMLSVWSGVYDNIYEHPESPADEVINDDDLLDGWMIVQKRKRDTQKEGVSADELINNEKIRNSEEVFIPADTVADARKIEALNDPGVAALKRKRMALLEQKGVVDEKDMPDSQMKIRTEFNRLYVEQHKG